MIKAGMSPADVADHVFDAIKNKKFYILTHPDLKRLTAFRMKGFVDEQNPILPPTPDKPEQNKV
jgi:hypothetical protein